MSSAERPTRKPTVALISLESWDQVWRRNQHLAHQLLEQGLVAAITFVEPPALWKRPRRFRPEPGVDVVRPSLVLPRRLGGLLLLGMMLRRTTRTYGVLWVNDAPLGAACRHRGQPAVYDVTDDWRTLEHPARITRRVIAAEDSLTRSARVVVCSAELRERWRQRYHVDAAVVPNGVDAERFAGATPLTLPGSGPHVGYVGSLHSARLDLDVLLAIAAAGATVHLVGPDFLTTTERVRLDQPRIRRHGSVPGCDVANWMVSFDVLICPHLVTEFTRSLDAIKAYEYLAAGRPVVATATSGFQLLDDRAGVAVVAAADFPGAVLAAVGTPGPVADVEATWASRAVAFAAQLRGTS